MWQRWGNKQPAISYPTRFTQLDREEEYDERYLETILEVDSISSRRQSAHVGLPELPFRAVPPMREFPRQINAHPQPSPVKPTAKDHGLRINVQVQDQALPDNISPLTPRTSQERANERDEQPVSPIEPVEPTQARAPLPERTFQSQIPRKVSKPSESTEKLPTKWDLYSGEPTNDEAGKPASVRPGAAPVEMQYPHLKERTKQILAGIREREATKKTPWGKPPPPVADDPLDNPPQREPWKGASGRAPIVEPVKNTPTARKGPLPHPQRNSETQAHHAPVQEHGQEEPSPAPHTLRPSPSEEGIKPVVPLKTRNLTPPLIGSSPTQSPTKRSNVESPIENSEPIFLSQSYVPESSDGRVESPQYDPEPTTPTTPTREEPQIQAYADQQQPFVQPEIGREQSRFSWTTYTTSVAESPRSMAEAMRDSSPPPPIPDLPPASVTAKQRPASGSPFMHSGPYMHQQFVDSRGSVVRKPLPGQQSRTSSITSATSRAMSTSKSLPPTPTVVEAAGKIEHLDAQLDALNRRKRNITRILADLEASLKKNAVVYDMWKRKEIEKNIANHKMELDDIGRDVHEISLQLHRAQRKRDREDGYEACTGLWIKRVTS